MPSRQLLLRICRGFVYGVVALVLAKAWRVERQNERLADANKALRSAQDEILSASARPILIRGFSLPLLEHVDTIEVHKVAGPAPRHQLLLVYRADCGACKQQIPQWERLIRSPLLGDVEAWLVSIGKDAGEAAGLIHVLKDRGVPYRLLRTRDAAAFMVATGIGGVPITIVTDREGSVEFVEPGLADGARLDLILEGLARLASSGARILPFGQMEPLEAKASSRVNE
jgi:hypothetical protein